MQVAGKDPTVPTAWPVALVDLYRSRSRGYVRLAYLLTGDRGAAEELVQDAFLATAARWEAVREPAAYVRAAVVNRCRSWGRRLRTIVHRALKDLRKEIEP
jgi:DNA-directed RNA polymerase specialized sigma24 family protein